jgi:hypothetical protein
MTLRLFRGPKAEIPAVVDAGRPVLTTDTHELYVGTGTSVSPVKTDGANLTGVVNASEINGIPITGTLTHAGQIPISQPGNASAVWADPLVQGLFAPGANVLTANTGSTPINPVLIGAQNPSNLLKNLNVDSSGNLLVAGATTIGGSVAVTGTFWQATQPVSGTVAVTGTFWQATQPVSGSVSVSNFPATQPVSGTVAVTGTFWQTTQPVSGTFWQATQPVSGTVAVTGTFWQTTQPISIAAALPAGTNLLGQVSASNETSTVYNGTTALTPLFSTIVASASGVTNIIAAVSSKRIRVLSFRITASAAVNVKWQSHLLSPPVVTDVTGLAYYAANGGENAAHNPVGWFQTGVGEQLDLNLSAAVACGGSLTYVTV